MAEEAAVVAEQKVPGRVDPNCLMLEQFPLLGSLIINVANRFGQVELGYRLIFMAATLFLVVAAVGILFVREGGEGMMRK